LRFLGWIVGAPLAILAAVFAVANRHDVRLDLWPLPFSVDLPVYLAVLAPLVLGLILGAAASGLKLLAARRRAGVERRRAESLERQLAAALPPPSEPQ
jgi:putative membrane protein